MVYSEIDGRHELIVAGRPFTLTSRADRIDLLSNGLARIFDYKTARGWKLSEVRAGYKNDVQFSFYPWAIWKFGAHFLPLEMYNAARDLKITTQVVTAQITTKPPAWSVDSPVTCSTARFEEFELEVRRLLERLIPIYLKASANDVPWQNGHLSNQCPRCPYNDLCFAVPGMEDAIRQNLYMQKQYTPKTHS